MVIMDINGYVPKNPRIWGHYRNEKIIHYAKVYMEIFARTLD
jgi:hypothetical protein